MDGNMLARAGVEHMFGRLSLDHVSVPEVYRVAMFCIQPRPRRRPSMSSVLSMLLGEEKLEVVMRLPRISNGKHAQVLAESDLSSPLQPDCCISSLYQNPLRAPPMCLMLMSCKRGEWNSLW